MLMYVVSAAIIEVNKSGTGSKAVNTVVCTQNMLYITTMSYMGYL